MANIWRIWYERKYLLHENFQQKFMNQTNANYIAGYVQQKFFGTVFIIPYDVCANKTQYLICTRKFMFWNFSQCILM